jgi:hypothetical protein
MFILNINMLFKLICIDYEKEYFRISNEIYNYYMGDGEIKFHQIDIDVNKHNIELQSKLVKFLNLEKHSLGLILKYFGYLNDELNLTEIELCFMNKAKEMYIKIENEILLKINRKSIEESAKNFLSTYDLNEAIGELRKFNSGTNIKIILDLIYKMEMNLVSQKIKMLTNEYYNIQFKDSSVKLSKKIKKQLFKKYLICI